MNFIAMMKRVETGCLQRAGGWCEPMAECFRTYGFGAERSRAKAVRASPQTAASVQRG